MQLRNYVMINFLFILGLTACNAIYAEQDVGWTAYQNDELGISFDIPESWVIEENGGVVTIAANQESIENGVLTGAGASITLATARDFDGFSEPGGIMGLFMEYFEYGRENLERISEPELITVQELPASTVSYRGSVRERSGLFIATVISNEDHIALVLAIDGSENEENRATLERITQSLYVYPPNDGK